MDKKTLLNANYYIADIRSPDGNVQLGDTMKYNEDGQLVVDPIISPLRAMDAYNIIYGNGDLDPTPFITYTLVSTGATYQDPRDRFIKHLNSTDTLISVYNTLFRKPLKGDGLQILIFANDDIVADYAFLVCGYLASNFGVDITFIDPQFRPNIQGQTEYHGDKEYAKKNIVELNDAQLIIEFNQAVSQCGGAEAIGNLTSYLNIFDVRKLIYLYNLIFPNDPLPPDNYTSEHIKQIIIGRVTANMPKNNMLANLYQSDEYLKLLEEYSNDYE